MMPGGCNHEYSGYEKFYRKKDMVSSTTKWQENKERGNLQIKRYLRDIINHNVWTLYEMKFKQTKWKNKTKIV